MRNLQKIILDEIENDYLFSGYDLKDYIDENEMLLKQKTFMDYNIIDMIHNNLEIENKKLILKLWTLWKNKKLNKINS